MPDETLEQCLLLALGWRRTAAALLQQRPEEVGAPALDFAREQHKQASSALIELTRLIEMKKQGAIDAEQIALHKRSALVQGALDGQGNAVQINAEARRLLEQSEEQRRDAVKWETLLSQLRENAFTSLPAMPLPRYQPAYERLRDVLDHPSPATTGAEVRAAARPVAVWRHVLRRTDRADRFAITTAALFMAFVFIYGYHFTHCRGRVSVAAEVLADGAYRIVCVNNGRHAAMLYAPYDGQGFPQNHANHFGLLLEPADGSATSLSGLSNASWTYKDLPAHLHGPIVISPTTSATLQLRLPDDASPVRLVLVEAPRKRRMVIPLPSR